MESVHFGLYTEGDVFDLYSPVLEERKNGTCYNPGFFR